MHKYYYVMYVSRLYHFNKRHLCEAGIQYRLTFDYIFELHTERYNVLDGLSLSRESDYIY